MPSVASTAARACCKSGARTFSLLPALPVPWTRCGAWPCSCSCKRAHCAASGCRRAQEERSDSRLYGLSCLCHALRMRCCGLPSESSRPSAAHSMRAFAFFLPAAALRISESPSGDSLMRRCPQTAVAPAASARPPGAAPPGSSTAFLAASPSTVTVAWSWLTAATIACKLSNELTPLHPTKMVCTTASSMATCSCVLNPKPPPLPPPPRN